MKLEWAKMFALALAFLGNCTVLGQLIDEESFSKDKFPPDFIFGAGTSAYQVEGAVAEGGRSPSTWDIFTHSERGPDKNNGDFAANQYHKYKEDVKLMADMGLDAYRFSISWSRLIPGGRGAVNEEGLQYYNNLINELISHGIEPHVTLFHVDYPQVIEDEYKGWLSPRMVEDFTAFAETCFKEFGDRVKNWTSINEANVYAVGAFDFGYFPPGRCSQPFGYQSCLVGNSSLDPYIVVHHELLAHASVYQIYHHKFRVVQKGEVGINLYTMWVEPATNSSLDVEATQRVLDFYIGWILDPVTKGDYPKSMKKNVGPRLPSFTRNQSRAVKGSFDFIGVNYYASTYVKDSSSNSKIISRDYMLDLFATILYSGDQSDDKPDDEPGTITARGLRNLLLYLKNAYDNPPIIIQETGYKTPFNVTLNDFARANRISDYINATLCAIRDGSNTRGFFVWSFLDLYELLDGYQAQYGLYHVDFSSKSFTRNPKCSAIWYKNFLKSRTVMLFKRSPNSLTSQL